MWHCGMKIINNTTNATHAHKYFNMECLGRQL